GRVYALGITEAGGGTDVRANIATRAEELGGGSYRLEGMKYFTSNALYASHFVVLALAGEEPALFLCEKQPRIRVEPLDLSGFRGSGVGKVVFDGAVCERLTEPGVDGVRAALGYINVGRLGYASLALGIADRAIEVIVEAASSKRVFGKRLLDYQGVQWRIASIAARRAALESLVVSALAGGGRVDPEKAAMAKVLGGELALEAAWSAVQILGGRGLAMWGEAERMYRDAKVIDIGEGAKEVLMDYIAGRTVKKVLGSRG
ncbi:acyl-CoA dehydrogenase, partial [Aeropyrum pernix]